MRHLGFGMAAAAGLLVAVTAPSFAQRLYVDPGGVSVGIGDHRDRDWDRHRGERYFQRHHEFYGRGDCRDVTVQKRLPDGSIVTRRSRDCD